MNTVVIGAGIAGAVIARELAEKGARKVLVVDTRANPGGNCQDEKDEYGVLIHPYGPHIFHTSDKVVYEYLSRFTDWYHYGHEVVASVRGKLLPVPFNLNALRLVYGEEKAAGLEKKLISSYGAEQKVPILKLREHEDAGIQEIAEYVYQNIYLYYTMKQWGKKPEEIDPAVTGRVPVFISYDNRYFQDQWQGVPTDGYSSMFRRMLDHENIELRMETDAADIMEIRGSQLYVAGKAFSGEVIYTGALDELFGCCCGRLPYRSIDFEFEYFPRNSYQDYKVVNYTVDEDFTRITEYKKLTGQQIAGTTISREYPRDYTGADNDQPCYPIVNDENAARYEKYAAMAGQIPNLWLLGRLAEYKYYNMDVMTAKALKLAEQIMNR